MSGLVNGFSNSYCQLDSGITKDGTVRKGTLWKISCQIARKAVDSIKEYTCPWH